MMNRVLKSLLNPYKLISLLIIIISIIIVCWVFIVKFKLSGTDDSNTIMKKLNLSTTQDKLESFIKTNELYLDHLKNMREELIKNGLKVESTIEQKNLLDSVSDQYLALGLLEIAKKTYQVGLKIFVNDPYFTYKLGLVYSNLGVINENQRSFFFKEAQALFLKSIKLDKQNDNSYYALAMLYYTAYRYHLDLFLNPFDLSLKMINRFIDQSPSPLKGYVFRARLYYEQGKKAQSLKDYQTVLTLLKPKDAMYKEIQRNIVLLGK